MRALVLTGGGSRGAWQIGKARRLIENGKSYDHYIGTSVGAVNALGLSTMGPHKTWDLWGKLDGRRSVMRINVQMPWKWDGVFHFGPLKKLIMESVDWTLHNGSAHACVTNLETLGTEYASSYELEKEEFVDFVIGSCAIAGLQRPHKGKFVDGGHREFAPFQRALDLGCTEIDVISTSPMTESFNTKWKPEGIPALALAGRGIQAMAHEIWMRDVMHLPTVKIYAPESELPFDTLDYRRANLKAAMEAGYKED